MYEVYKGLGLVLVLEICQSVTMQFTQLKRAFVGDSNLQSERHNISGTEY